MEVSTNFEGLDNNPWPHCRSRKIMELLAAIFAAIWPPNPHVTANLSSRLKHATSFRFGAAYGKLGVFWSPKRLLGDISLINWQFVCTGLQCPEKSCRGHYYCIGQPSGCLGTNQKSIRQVKVAVRRFSSIFKPRPAHSGDRRYFQDVGPGSALGHRSTLWACFSLGLKIEENRR